MQPRGYRRRGVPLQTETVDLAIFVMLHGGDPDLDIETRLPSHTAHCCDGRRSSWKVP